MKADPSQISLSKELSRDVAVHTNVKQEIIVITSDKAKLCLQKHLINLAQQGSWVAPAGIFAAIIIAW
jgi:hypothetical protein